MIDEGRWMKHEQGQIERAYPNDEPSHAIWQIGKRRHLMGKKISKTNPILK